MGPFDRTAIASLLHRLREVCAQCGLEVCDARSECGVWWASGLLDGYLSHERMLVEQPKTVVPRPPEADPNPRELAVCLASLAQLCACCMFHKAECVINQAFSALEDARDLRFRKPLHRRPAEFIFG